MDENLPNKIDRIFKDSLNDFESNPSKKVWDKIETNLDDDQDGSGWFLLNRTRVAVAFLFLSLFVTGILTLHPAKKSVQVAQDLTVKATIPVISNNSVLNKHRTAFSSPGYNVLPVADQSSQKKPVHITNNRVNAETNYELGPFKKSRIQTVEFKFDDPNVKPVELALTKTNISPVVHQKQRIKNRLSITPYFSREFAGYDILDINDVTGPNGQEIEERERNVFSASVGFFINYEISRKWVIQSGLSFSWSNSNIDSSTSYAVLDNHGKVQYKLKTVAGYGYLPPPESNLPNIGDSLSTAKSNSQLRYLSIPLIISYRIPMNKFSLLIGLGGTLNILTSAEIETETYGGSLPEKEYDVTLMGLKKINYGMLLKLDLQYQISPRFGVNLMPSFKNTLSPINFHSDMPVYPYNIGIGLGLTYHF